MAHTPGPWVSGNDGRHRAWIADLHNGVGVFTERRFKAGETYEWGDREADARLIAAAPDMLAALIAQEELAALRFEGEPETAIARVREIRRAAIAKATL